MIRVHHDLESAIASLEKEAKPTLKKHQEQMFFTPERHKRKHAQMKKKANKCSGGHLNGRR